MAITQQRLQVTFAGANSVAVPAAGGQSVSDTLLIDPGCIESNVTVKATSAAGIPTADDIVRVYYAGSCGDTLNEPDVADEYPTNIENMGAPIGVIDCSNTNGDQQTLYFPSSPKSAKLVFVTDALSTAVITVSAQVEQDVSSS